MQSVWWHKYPVVIPLFALFPLFWTCTTSCHFLLNFRLHIQVLTFHHCPCWLSHLLLLLYLYNTYDISTLFTYFSSFLRFMMCFVELDGILHWYWCECFIFNWFTLLKFYIMNAGNLLYFWRMVRIFIFVANYLHQVLSITFVYSYYCHVIKCDYRRGLNW
jgi:uncharacterized protein Usg